MELNSPITKLGKVGVSTAKRLKKLGIETVEDLLWHLPFRYDDFSQSMKISDLVPGDQANIIGTVDLIQNKRSARKKINITEALISDESDSLKVIWFNQPYLAKSIHVGVKISLAGKVDSEYGAPVLISPVYEKLTQSGPIHTRGLIPIYHLSANLTHKQIRYLIKQIIDLSEKVEDWMPLEIINKFNFLNISDALKKIHFPKNFEDISQAQTRLAFNELFLLQLTRQIINLNIKNKTAPVLKFFEKETKKFVEDLPFQLTKSQKKSAWEIIGDISKNNPMSRLLEGDVGSGKTVVAGLALLNSALNKKQGLIMAPTEILATQHFKTLNKIFAHTGFKLGLVTRTKKSLTGSDTKLKTEEIISQADILVGTHALIQDKLNFEKLGLVIIDEQHRFGVKQRKKLLNLNNVDNGQITPHFLSMTATPIPRSLALALYGDLKISVINELPKGRKPIITRVVSENKRPDAYKFLRAEITKGRQVFVVCPLIDISDKLGIKSVKEEYDKLNNLIFPDLKIASLHGKMKAEEKDNIMENFANNKINILVSTSVIEVGVDIPNASIMMIEGAERFGLAQLHQFRGRIGRGEHQSYCFLFTDSNSTQSLERLKAMEKYTNGFELSKIDLELRGPGTVYGSDQSGYSNLKIASLLDLDIMEKAQTMTSEIISDDPELKKYPELKNKLDAIEEGVHLE